LIVQPVRRRYRLRDLLKAVAPGNLHGEAGHGQSGKRPALVLSPAAYNGCVGLALLCPITSQRKGYPFEVALPAGARVQGVVLADQVKSLDWRARRAERVEAVPPAVLDEAVAKIRVLLEPEAA
jgi:mRNA interferase MazF